MNAKFIVCFEDMNYENWVAACGAEFLRLEPLPDGAFELHVRGSESAITQFRAELGLD